MKNQPKVAASINSFWQWQDWQGLPYLTCTLLDNWRHGFFTQQFQTHSLAELTEILAKGAEMYRVQQVHGNLVLDPQAIKAHVQVQGKTDSYPAADGIVTNTPQAAVWVASADCTPVLIGDVVTGNVAAVHAGWRGTAKKIVPQAINQLIQRGSQLENLRFALGPAISGEVYQLTETVAAEVIKTIVAAAKEVGDSPQSILQQASPWQNKAIFTDPQPGRIKIDVRQVSAIQISQLGVKPEHIAIAPHCTYQEPDKFFSYRRSKEKKVQWSGIVSS